MKIDGTYVCNIIGCSSSSKPPPGTSNLWKGIDLQDDELRSLAGDIPSILLQDRAPQTVRKYQETFIRWQNWAESKGLCALPSTGQEVALYIAFLLRSARTMSPIHAAVCAIAWAHKKAAKPSPTEHTLVKQMVEASRRIVGVKPVNRKKPLEAVQVKKIVQKFGDGNLSQLQMATLTTLGFSAFLRWDDLSKLEKQDIVFEEDHMRIFLVKRKNDQYREGSWILVARSGSPTCPVKLLERFLAIGKHTMQDKLFRRIVHTPNGMRLRQQSLSYSRARELFRKQVSGIGLDPTSYGLHSLRSGGTSQAAAWGIPDRLIQRHGGWRSERSMNMYIEETHQTLLRVSRSLGL